MQGVLFYHSPPYSLETESLTDPGVKLVAASPSHPLSPLPNTARITGSYIVIPYIHVDVGNLNTGAYSYTASTHTAIFPVFQSDFLTP